MSDEEVPFKSMKITLSDDALEKLSALLKTGSFRSYSSTIEECIRAIYDVSFDMAAMFSVVPKGQKLTNEQLQEAFRRYMMRLARFFTSRLTQDEVNRSAGT